MLKDQIIETQKFIDDAQRAYFQEDSLIKRLMDKFLKPPKYLYRYCSLDRFALGKEKTILENFTKTGLCDFWMNKSSNTNDYYDFYPQITTEDITQEDFIIFQQDPTLEFIFKENNRDLKTMNLESFIEFFNEFIIFQIDFARETTRMLCFKTHYDNLRMWSLYGDSHKGVCIQFNTNLLHSEVQKSIMQVNYVDIEKRPIIKAKEFIQNLLGFKLLLNENMYAKDSFWEYENEYRLIPHQNSYQNTNAQPPDTFSVPPKVISNLIIGRNVTKNKLLELKELGVFSLFKVYRIKETKYSNRAKKLICIDENLKETELEFSELEK